jgi:glycosyltransferase involved in cell wall biosynthesis
MKILHIIPSYAPAYRYGGPIVWISQLVKKLVRLGEDVTVFTTNIDGPSHLDVPRNREIIADGIKVYYFQVDHPRSYSLSYRLASAIKREIKRFDLVHITSLFNFPSMVGSFYCRRYEIPYIISPRGCLDPISLSKGGLKKRIHTLLFDRRNISAARAIHFTTDMERKRALYVDARTPTFVIPNSIDPDEFLPLPPGSFRVRHPETRGKGLILFLGRLNWTKGLDILARAFGLIARSRGDLHLVIAGPDEGGYELKLKGWLKSEGVLGKTTFTGMLTGRDKLALLVDSDLVVLPSYIENFGLVALEAMMCGKPVITSEMVGISPEIIKAGAGMVVPCDYRRLAEAIQRLLVPAERIKLGQAGKLLAKEKFNIGRIASQMQMVYRGILEGKMVLPSLV